MTYQPSLTKRELIDVLKDVPDDHEIFITKDGEPLWLFADVVGVAIETEEGSKEILANAVAIPACDEEWFD